MKPNEADELLGILRTWKNEERKIVLWLELPGRASLKVDRIGSASIEHVPDSVNGEIAFRFGWSTASGILSIPLSNEIVSYRIQKPDEPSPFGRVSSDYEACVKFTWGTMEDYCWVCAYPKESHEKV